MAKPKIEADHGGDLPIRPCHGGCGHVDDHPRVQFWRHMGPGPGGVEFYHYDDECYPEHLFEDHVREAHEPIRQARRDGKRGQALREFAEQHAASIEEAPADDESER